MPRKTSGKYSKPRRTSKSNNFLRRPPRGCRLCRDKIQEVDYKNTELLQRYITERGKIVPSRISGACASHQRRLANAIKRARTMALLPFVGE